MQRKVVGLMILTAVASGSTAMAFPDTLNHWADIDIEKLSELDILAGYDDGTFKPDEYITRAEASKVITIAKQLDMQNRKSLNISDMDETHWSYDYVLTLASNGFIKGYPDGSFRPDKNITREEFATMIYNTLKLESSEQGKFVDIGESYAKEAIERLSGAGVISGYQDNSFKPTNNITRGEATAMISRALSILRESNVNESLNSSAQVSKPSYTVNENTGNKLIESETAGEKILDSDEVKVNGPVDQMLNKFKKEALKAVTKFDSSFTVRFETPISQNDVEAALLEVLETNYEGSRVSNVSRMTQMGNENGQPVLYQVRYNLKYNRDSNEEKQIDSEVKTVLPQIINQNMNEQEKLKSIYDYIIRKTVYASNYKTNSMTAEGHSVYSPMAILKSGKAICNGYAGLFYKMANAAGIEVEYEAGKVISVGDDLKHAWNKVKVDGEWKYIDTTWGDNENPEINYSYFLIDRAEFARDHTLR